MLDTLEALLKCLLAYIKSEKTRGSEPGILPNCNCNRGFVKKSNFNTSSKSRKVRCTYCKQKGHYREQCYRLNKSCYECGSSGHFVRQCPIKSPLDSSRERMIMHSPQKVSMAHMGNSEVSLLTSTSSCCPIDTSSDICDKGRDDTCKLSKELQKYVENKALMF